MKKSRFTDSQILSILKQNESSMAVPDLCREHGMSSATYCNRWCTTQAVAKSSSTSTFNFGYKWGDYNLTNQDFHL